MSIQSNINQTLGMSALGTSMVAKQMQAKKSDEDKWLNGLNDEDRKAFDSLSASAQAQVLEQATAEGAKRDVANATAQQRVMNKRKQKEQTLKLGGGSI